MLTGIQKAALLLTTLDPATATELLKGQPADVVQKIAMELAQLDAKGLCGSEQATMISRTFCTELQHRGGGSLHVKSFISNLLQSTSGKEKVSDIQSRLEKAVREKDPFIYIANSPAEQIAAAVGTEPAQAIALVLSALPPKLSTEVLAKLDESLSTQVIWRMTLPQEVSIKTLRRIGEIVCNRLMEMNSEQQVPVIKENASKETLRRVALVLSGLPKDRRDSLLEQIRKRDEATANTVKALMVTWEDIVKIDDKCLQGLLRKVEAGILAKALFGADEAIAKKIRSNISERLSQMIDDELSLIGEPRKKDVQAAREEVAKPLREANESGDLLFIEEEE
ncbi:FliG C-terminal domain-containing protein [Anaerohalosphaeraceae bacterium U12dextr]|jgi:flagellar motor switch protein FliG